MDMTRCPQTEDEFAAYFYALIGRTPGGPANDYEAVLSALYPWNGQLLMIPPGVGPGIKQYPGAPFFGLTQQYSGTPKARVFLPADTPDDLGYYTRCMQYVDDAAHTLSASKKQPTAQSTGLVWAWYLAGPDNAYAPIQGPDAGSGTTPPAGDYQDQIDALNDRLEALEASNATLEASNATLEERLTVVETALAGGFHAHGPVNLPIVLESLTSLRCKGDIDVTVKPGQATPPDMSAGDPPDAATIVMARELLRRLRERLEVDEP